MDMMVWLRLPRRPQVTRIRGYGDGGFDPGEIQLTVLQLRRQMGRGGEVEDGGRGQPRFVHGQFPGAHQLPVTVEILGKAIVAGLHQLDGDGVDSLTDQMARHHADGDGFADSGIDSTDEEDAHNSGRFLAINVMG